MPEQSEATIGKGVADAEPQVLDMAEQVERLRYVIPDGLLGRTLGVRPNETLDEAVLAPEAELADRADRLYGVVGPYLEAIMAVGGQNGVADEERLRRVLRAAVLDIRDNQAPLVEASHGNFDQAGELLERFLEQEGFPGLLVRAQTRPTDS